MSLSLIKLGSSEVVGKTLQCSLQNDSASIRQLQSIRHLIKISERLWAASLSLLLCREGQRRRDGFSFLPGVRRVSFLRTSKRAAYSCGERANLCHLLKQPGSSSLLGELLILSLYDLTCVTVFCMLACRKCYLPIHSWRIISFYLWLLPIFGISAASFLSALKRHTMLKPNQAQPPSLPPNLCIAVAQRLPFFSVQEERCFVKVHCHSADFTAGMSSVVAHSVGSQWVLEADRSMYCCNHTGVHRQTAGVCCVPLCFPDKNSAHAFRRERLAVMPLWRRRGGRSEKIYGASTRACMVH